MARYVMTNWRAGKLSEAAKFSARASVAATLGRIASALPYNVLALDDRHQREIVIFDADPSEIERIKPSLSLDVILEPEIMHRLAARPLDLITPHFQLANVNTTMRPEPALSLTVYSEGRALEGAAVTVFARGLGGRQREYTIYSELKWAG